MDTTANRYRETQILTATPQQLRLLLIEGALRFARTGLEAWERQELEAGFHALVKCREVVFELMTSVTRNGASLNRNIAGVYLFLYQNLLRANLLHDPEMVKGVIRILEVERETWRQVVDQLASGAGQTHSTSRAPLPAPHFPLNAVKGAPTPPGQQLSLDA